MAWDRVSLEDAMITRMDEDEVEDICFRLRVDDEGLDKKTKNSLVRSLIKYMEQRNALDVLTGELAKMRPDIKPPAEPAADADPTAPITPPTSPVASPGSTSSSIPSISDALASASNPSGAAPVSPSAAGPSSQAALVGRDPGEPKGAETIAAPMPDPPITAPQDANPQAVPSPSAAASPAPASATPNAGDRMTDAMGVTMVYVPPGRYVMGDLSSYADAPEDVVIAHGFWLDLTPVTNVLYAEFIAAGGYKNSDYWTKEGWEWVQQNDVQRPTDDDGFAGPDQPRVQVTWFEAYAYCRWRGGRLPTEAEWEWAATGPESRKFPWGNDFDAARVVFKENSNGVTAPVSASARAPGAAWVGALDMSGNVSEWVSSLCYPYPYKVDDGREDLSVIGGFVDVLLSPRKTRVYRGGSWRGGEGDLHSAARDWDSPDTGRDDVGFRCARDA